MKRLILFSIITILFTYSCDTYTYQQVTNPKILNLPDSYYPPKHTLNIVIASNPQLVDLERMLERRGHKITHIDQSEFSNFMKSDEAKKYNAVIGLLRLQRKKYFQSNFMEFFTIITLGIIPSYSTYGYNYEIILYLPQKHRSGKVEWSLKEKEWHTLFAPIVNAISFPNRKYMAEYTRMQLKASYLVEILVE